jgi:decaprenyl-phosphate phosphoribosyltransferase
MLLFDLLRIPQWVKNLFLFLPLFFAGQFTNAAKLTETFFAFILFSILASSVYIINDIRDVKQDRLHPVKKRRPLALGKIGADKAFLLSLVLAGLSLGLSGFIIGTNFLLVLLTYFFLNLGYSAGLKKISLLDVTMVSFGFVLRIMAGGMAANVPVSEWIIVMTFLLALFIGLAKRRDDVVLFNTSGTSHRKASEGYNMDFLHAAMGIVAAVSIVAYLLYTLSEEVQVRFDTEYLYMTGLFVILGFLRYLQISLVEQKSGSPTQLFWTDRPLQIILVAWILSLFLIIYAPEWLSM